MRPDSTPHEQVPLAARRELPNAPQELFVSILRETDQHPKGIHSFVTNGTRELHTVYVYVLDITHLTHADGEWVPGTVKVPALTTFERAAEDSHHYWRSCYLRGLIYA